MYCNALTIEYTMERPQPDLGDEGLSPLFHRVSAACPVLSIFGYATVPGLVLEQTPSEGGGRPPRPDSERIPPATGMGVSMASLGDSRGALTDANAGLAMSPTFSPEPTVPRPRCTHSRTAPALDPTHEPAAHPRGSVPPPPQWSVCLHIHGVYPYILTPQYDRAVSAVQFGAQLETVALRVMDGEDAGGGPRPTAPPHRQLLHHVEIVHKIPLYGYHAHPYPFYQIHVIDPAHLPAIAQLLQSTTRVGGRAWQLYEAHYPYHTQLMMDYDIVGMSSFPIPPTCVLRGPVEAVGLRGRSAAWLRRHCGIGAVRLSGEGPVRRTTVDVELDVAAADLARGARPGSHLRQVRDLVRTYFAECGVRDELRWQNTIAAELRAQEAWRTCADRAGPPTSSSPTGTAFVPRHGAVTLLQRCDPVARALRRRMLAMVRDRLCGHAVVTPSPPADTAVSRTRTGPTLNREAPHPRYIGDTPPVESASAGATPVSAGHPPLTYELMDAMAATTDGAGRHSELMAAMAVAWSASPPSSRSVSEGGSEQCTDAGDTGEERGAPAQPGEVSVPPQTPADEDVWRAGDSIVWLLACHGTYTGAGGATVACTLLIRYAAGRLLALPDPHPGPDPPRARLQPYVGIEETALAVDAAVLVRQGRWLGPGLVRGRCTTVADSEHGLGEWLLLRGEESGAPESALRTRAAQAVAFSSDVCRALGGVPWESTRESGGARPPLTVTEVCLLPPQRVLVRSEPSPLPTYTVHDPPLNALLLPGGPATGQCSVALSALCRYEYGRDDGWLRPVCVAARRCSSPQRWAEGVGGACAQEGEQEEEGVDDDDDEDVGGAALVHMRGPSPLWQTMARTGTGGARTHGSAHDSVTRTGANADAHGDDPHGSSPAEDGDEHESDEERESEDDALADGSVRESLARLVPALLTAVNAARAADPALDALLPWPCAGVGETQSPVLTSAVSPAAAQQQWALTQCRGGLAGESGGKLGASPLVEERGRGGSPSGEDSVRSDEPLFHSALASPVPVAVAAAATTSTPQGMPAVTAKVEVVETLSTPSPLVICSTQDEAEGSPLQRRRRSSSSSNGSSLCAVETLSQVREGRARAAGGVAGECHDPGTGPPVALSEVAVSSRCGADLDGLLHPYMVTVAPTSARAACAPHLLVSTAGAMASRREDVAAAHTVPAPALVEPEHQGSHARPHTRRGASVSERQLRICSLRVLYVEVLMHRLQVGGDVGSDRILAVALGTTTSDAEAMAVELLTVEEAVPQSRPQATGGADSGTGGGPSLAGVRALPGMAGRVSCVVFASEAALLLAVAQAIRRVDPGVVMSWEGFKYGLGLLALRYRVVLGRSLTRDLSRFSARAASSATEVGGNTSDTARVGHGGAAVVQEPVWEGKVEDGEVHSSVAGAGTTSDEEEDETGDGVGGGEVCGGSEAPTAAALARRYVQRFGAVVRVPGRVCRSLGKDLRKRVKTPSHTLAMVYAEVVGESMPYFTDTALAQLYTSPAPADRFLAQSYLVGRVVAAHRIAHRLRYFSEAAEFSAMYGILFEEVLSRGSQFRVEATLVRVARPQHYALISPSRAQVFQQPRIQCVPLILQPRSGFYNSNDPILVLDFRSLYPSIAIAYNLCYTTCVGLVQRRARGRLGVLEHYKQDTNLLWELLQDECEEESEGESGGRSGGSGRGQGASGIVVSPSGAMFVSPATRHGVLPQMLQAVLDTRFEVQAALQYVAGPCGDATMTARLQARQQALKMLANVTYGYTGASYTGRMPCVDVAEAIVSLGRQTLERAIALVHSTARWGAEVVYGDTDSLFIRLRGAGRTRQEAFAVGEEIAQAVTASNPVPVRLQFEKILSPCLLLVKKRYVGYAWFHRDQREPTFLDKGIETVRRDQCPAVARLTRRLLTHLFDCDRSGVDVHHAAWRADLMKLYRAEVSPLLTGEANPFDFIFRRAVKLGRYGADGAKGSAADAHLPLAARVALARMSRDLLSTPHWGERLPYVVVSTPASVRLRDRVAHPEVLLFLDTRAILDAEYYIHKHVNPTLDRIFYLLGVSFAGWYGAMARGRWYSRPPLSSACPRVPILSHAEASRLHQLLRSPHRERRPVADRRHSPTPQTTTTPTPVADGEERAVIVVDDEGVGERGEARVGVRVHRPHRPRPLHKRGREEFQPREDSRYEPQDKRTLTVVEAQAEEDRETGHSQRVPLTRSAVDVDVDVDALSPPDAVGLAEEVVVLCTPGLSSPRSVTAPGRPPAPPAPPVMSKARLEDYCPTSRCVVCTRVVVEWPDVLSRFSASRRRGCRTGNAPSPLLVSAPRVHDVDRTLPPLCRDCLADPPGLLSTVTTRTRALHAQLAALQAHCRRCMAWCPTSGGELVDVEACADGYAISAVPMDWCGAVHSARGVATAMGGGGSSGNGEEWTDAPTIGCLSSDCRLNYEKRRCTLVARHMRLLEAYLQAVLSS